MVLNLFRREQKVVPVHRLGDLAFSDPWARPDGKVPGQAGGYFTVGNTGTESDRLTGATSPKVGKIEIHAITVVGPDIQMKPRENGLAVPSGYTTTLKPRGYHLLLQGLTAPLTAGERLPVTLTFDKAGEITLDLIVREPGPVGRTAITEEPA